MDRYVKNFIAMSIIYLAAASIMGIAMFVDQALLGPLKFAHSHLMLLGWVSMMIYGVGYHILPRFAGKLLKNRGLAEAQFWAANIGLLGMAVFYPLMQYRPEESIYRTLSVLSGALEVLSIFVFLYNMAAILFTPVEEH